MKRERRMSDAQTMQTNLPHGPQRFLLSAQATLSDATTTKAQPAVPSSVSLYSL